MKKEIEHGVNKALKILDEILLLSEKGLQRLEQDELNEYNKILQERQKKISALADLKKLLFGPEKTTLTIDEKDIINNKFQKKLENLAKVDKKTFDIMKYKRLVLKGKMGQANQGKSFLKNYKKQVNSRKTFFKMI